MDRREYLEGKFGGKTQAVQVYTQIDAAAKIQWFNVGFRGDKAHAEHSGRASFDLLERD